MESINDTLKIWSSLFGEIPNESILLFFPVGLLNLPLDTFTNFLQNILLDDCIMFSRVFKRHEIFLLVCKIIFCNSEWWLLLVNFFTWSFLCWRLGLIFICLISGRRFYFRDRLFGGRATHLCVFFSLRWSTTTHCKLFYNYY